MKHASRLNTAEIEIAILDRQCLDRRVPNCTLLAAQLADLSAAP
ncbi:MAG TPA: hypothetical protein VN326_06155 [Casimicrobiaceae bacterium]|nr:hypothetical protein [Casimicrobiaceae bacterium]